MKDAVTTVSVTDLVTFLFSKNAGPYLVTFDMLFKDRKSYIMAKSSGVLCKETFASTYKIPEYKILSVYEYDAAYMIKFTMVRDVSSGDFGDRSVFGAQLWAPLMDLQIPVS